MTGTADSLVVKDWYLGTPHQIEEFQFGDGALLTQQQAANMVSAMAAFATTGSASGTQNATAMYWHETTLSSPVI